eukprot:TRINITY_DN16759_c0_g4_i1.p1 TRINITY_DN16759_c0_g4~~TRINITY_DN16759_c0_g4_i1.p1  ORF type:complete len:132 (-),score=48.00 TRINITY_DN16759_c0_g4_i1:271-666(-)
MCIRDRAEAVRCNTIRMESLSKELEKGQENRREIIVPYTYPKSDETKGKKAVRKKLSMSTRIVELNCKVMKISVKNRKEEVLGYDVRVRMPSERAKNLTDHSTDAAPLEFLYDKKLNRYFQALPSQDSTDV